MFSNYDNVFSNFDNVFSNFKNVSSNFQNVFLNFDYVLKINVFVAIASFYLPCDVLMVLKRIEKAAILTLICIATIPF